MTNTKVIKGMLQVGLLLAAMPLAACVATVGVRGVSIPPDAAQTCGRHCQTIGMQLSAVAIMADNVGCVCQAAAEPRASADAAGQLGTPPAGVMTIAAQEAAAAMALQQQQRQQQQQLQH